jgi:hypothetical protein
MADLSVTKRQLVPLSEEEISRHGFTHVAVIEASDINKVAGANGDTVTVDLGSTPPNFLVDRGLIFVETAFATTGTLTVEAGTDGDPNNFIEAVDAKTAGPVANAAGAITKTLAGSFGAAADVLWIRFNTQAATGKPGDITAGKLHLFLRILDVAALARGVRP